MFVYSGRMEDPSEYVRAHAGWDNYWEDKLAHPEWINVPVYTVASWTNSVHTPGTFKAWSLLPDNIPKWLRIHNKLEWSDYYDESSQKDLLRYFDHYLHGQTSNGWLDTPEVRVSVFARGLSDNPDTVNRPELEFPFSRTEYRRYYLNSGGLLSREPPSSAGIVSYRSEDEVQSFEFQMPAACETTGYFLAHLGMSTDEHDEIDVFVQVERLSEEKKKLGTPVLWPQNCAAQRVLKFAHNAELGMGYLGAAFHWGPDGQMRASYALDKDAEKSSPSEPFYIYSTRVPLRKGERRAIDVPLRPYGLHWRKGDYLRIKISGKCLIDFPIKGVQMHQTNNKGKHVIHYGGKGEDSSYILLPHVG